MAVFYATMLGVLIAFPLPARPGDPLRRAGRDRGRGRDGLQHHFAGFRDRSARLPDARTRSRTSATAPRRSRDARRRPARGRDRGATAQRLIAAYDVDRAASQLLEGHTVHLDPSEAAAIWAYELDWEPAADLPALHRLDRRSSTAATPRRVAAADGPERILRQNLDALGRYPGLRVAGGDARDAVQLRGGGTTARVAGAGAGPRPLRRAAAARQRPRAPTGSPSPFPRRPRARRLRRRARDPGRGPRAPAHGLLRSRGRQVTSPTAATRSVHVDRRDRGGRPDPARAALDRLPRPVRARPERGRGDLPLRGRARGQAAHGRFLRDAGAPGGAGESGG